MKNATIIIRALVLSGFFGTLHGASGEDGVRHGEIRVERHPDESKTPAHFRLNDDRFSFTQTPAGKLARGVTLSTVTFPSPMKTPHANNNTVHCEFYQASGAGRRPAVVVLHILGGDFALSRLFCNALAQNGVHALFVKMPYYGPRRQPGVDARMVSRDPRQTVRGMTQAVLDIRRAAAWLAGQNEVDGGQLGIFGISLGGITASLAATAEPRFASVCALLAGGDIGAVAWESPELADVREFWIKGGTRETLVSQLHEIDPMTYGRNVHGRRILMLNAAKDEVIPRRCTEARWNAFGKPEIVWYEAGHYSALAHIGDAIKRVTMFFQPREKQVLAARDEQATLPEVAKVGEGGYVSGAFVYALDDRPTPQCHASTLAQLPDGTIVAAWFGGTRESHSDVGIWFSRREKDRWSKPVELVDGSEGEERQFACWNPVLFQPANGPLLLFYKVGPSPSRWWGMLIASDDGGLSWSTPRRLGKSEQLGSSNPNLIGPVKNKPVQLEDGSILCPSSSEHDGWRVHFERTNDLGKTWEVVGPINDGKKFSAIQPSILTHADSAMQILCRTRQNVLAQAWSTDGGRTWSEVTATELPNPNAGTDAVTLSDGRQLLVYNHTTRRTKPAGREMLNVAISREGKQWKPVLTLERQRGEFSYPAVIQTSDRKVHVTYTYQRRTIKHVVLNPQEIDP